MKKLILFLLLSGSLNCFCQVKPSSLKVGKTIFCADLSIFADSVRWDINIDWKGKCARVVKSTMDKMPDTSYLVLPLNYDCQASRNINKERLRRAKQ